MPAIGVWGRPTSNIDWCELNYEVTPYMAEFWNTVSNLCIMVPALNGAISSWTGNFDRKYTLTFLSVFLVGVGSTLFHMTLKYEMQLCDELPMVFSAICVIYCQIDNICQGQPDIMQKTLICLIVSACTLTLIYIGLNNPIFYQLAYGVILSMVSILELYIERYICSKRHLMLGSAISFVVAVTLWILDNILCSDLTAFRRDRLVPSLLIPLSQFHALWHCSIGVSVYLVIIHNHTARLAQKSKSGN
ncbi:ACER3 (predicted) [Pycnogonum litorale]